MSADVDLETSAVTFKEETASNPTAVTAAIDTSWGIANNETWFVVNDNVTIGSRVTVNGTVNLILCDGKTLSVGKGITTTGATLNIYAQSEGTGKLVIEIPDENDYANNAGIGGANAAGGTVVIHGGVITVTGGKYAAGIGGGGSGVGGSVTIYGGEVTANGGVKGAGIGGSGTGGTVTIYDGKVTATGGKWNDGKYGGAGIGGTGGNNSNSGGGAGATVVIHGGVVEAIGGHNAAGIGGGGGSYINGGAGGKVTIYGGTVTATGSSEGYGCGAGIGGGGGCNESGYGSAGNGGEVTIHGGTVIATGGGSGGAGIGGGGSGSAGGCKGGTVTINGGMVVANGGSNAEGIGKGKGGTASGSLKVGKGVTVYGDDSNDSPTAVIVDSTAPDTAVTALKRYMKTVFTATVTLTGGANANVSGSTAQSVTANKEITPVTYTAETHYHFSEFSAKPNKGITVTWSDDKTVTVSGTPTADVTIEVPNAVLNTYTVTLTGGANANISGSTTQSVSADKEMTPVTYTAKDGYSFREVEQTTNGITVKCTDGKTLTVSGKPDADAEITVLDAESTIVPHTVTLTGGANADVSGGATTQTNLTGKMATVTYTARSGYYFAEFADITNNGVTAKRTNSTTVTVSGTPAADVTIEVPDAVLISYTVTLSGGANANVNGSTTQTVTGNGAMTTVTYTAKSGYHFAKFDDITNNGVTATWSDDKTVTVSGTPTADAEITVPDAEKEASEEKGTPAKIVIGDEGSNAKSVSEYVNDPANANMLQEVTQMELTDSTTLTDLSGIEKLTNLQELNVSGSTSLATADLSKNTNLQKVNLKGCANLETVDVSGCKNLQALNVSGTAVTELDVSGCTALVSLDVSSGDLEGLKMENCPNLAYLDCSKNSLLSLDLSGFEKLVSADCHSQDRTGLTSAKQNDGTWKVALPDGLATGTVRVSAAGFVTDSVKVYDKDGKLMTATAAGTYASQPATVKYNYNTGYTDKASGKDVLMDVTLTGGVSPTPGYNGPTSSKGSGGCNVGLGLAGLLAVVGLTLRRRK